jgi:glutathione S-transferase
MKLVGMLDSPYVRRTAICLDALGLPFEHDSVSVFSTFERFRAINPVVKAPTLVLDDGSVLMDSSLILQYAENHLLAGRASLWSEDPRERQQQFVRVGLAMAACDKSVQLIYESQLRPAAAQHQPWKDRVRGQFGAAFARLESLTPADGDSGGIERLNHASIVSAVVWQCVQAMIADEVPAGAHPRLAQLSQQYESLSVFRRYPPDGPGVPGLNPAPA